MSIYTNMYKTKMISIGRIKPDLDQPRKEFDIGPLANSIKMMGVRDPITVRPVGKKYIIIDGERRYRACLQLKYRSIMAVIDMTGVDPAVSQMVLNGHRKELDSLELAGLYKRVQEEHGFSNQQLADWSHKSKSHVSGILKLAELSKEEKKKVRRAELSLGRAIKIAQKTPEQRKEELAELIEKPAKPTRKVSIGTEFTTQARGEYRTMEIQRLQKKLMEQPRPESFEEWKQMALKIREKIEEIHRLEKEMVEFYNQVVERGLEERKKIPGKRKTWGGVVPSRIKPPGKLLLE